jgi:hypothetical protein
MKLGGVIDICFTAQASSWIPSKPI